MRGTPYLIGEIIKYSIEDGAIFIDVTGGATPYTYFWSNGAMVEDINNLTAGPYEITIYDANGCTASKSIPVFGLHLIFFKQKTAYEITV